MTEIKPCPFCGNSDEQRFTLCFSDVDVAPKMLIQCVLRCDECGARIGAAGECDEDAEKNVLKQWNRRAE